MEKQKLHIEQDFNYPSIKEWEAAAEKLLKGKPFKETLYSQTEDGLEVKPIYGPSDHLEINLGLNATRRWYIAQSLFAANDTFNEVAKDALSLGQTALNIDLDLVSQFGNHAPHIPNRMGFVHLTEPQAFESLFKNIDLNRVALLFDAMNTAPKLFDWLDKYVSESGFDPHKISGGFGFDPISAALKYGGFYQPLSNSMEKIAPVVAQEMGFTNFDIITIYANLIHNAGGHKVHALSYFLANVVEYIRRLGDLGVAAEKVLSNIRVKVSVGNDQFMEIAKLRALRLLWQNLCNAYDVDPVKNSLKIDVESSWRFMSKMDPWTNMLRATSAAFSAIVGGCDSLDILPFDLALGTPDGFSMRQARNTAIVLAEESNLDKVIDPASGSGYLDSATNDLAGKAWQAFQKIEKDGGILRQIRSGQFQEGVEYNAAKQLDEFRENKRKAIGTNIYPNPNEKLPEKTGKKISFENLTGDVAEEIKPLNQRRVLELVENSGIY
jgi:methylmalonyl-CoA mutase